MSFVSAVIFTYYTDGVWHRISGSDFHVLAGVTYKLGISFQGDEGALYIRGSRSGNIMQIEGCTGFISWTHTPTLNETLSWCRNSLNLCQAVDTNGVASGSQGTIVALPTTIAAQGTLTRAANQVRGLLANSTYRVTMTIAAHNFSSDANARLILTGSVTGSITDSLTFGNTTSGLTTMTAYHTPTSNENLYMTYFGAVTYTQHRVSLEVLEVY